MDLTSVRISSCRAPTLCFWDVSVSNKITILYTQRMPPNIHTDKDKRERDGRYISMYSVTSLLTLMLEKYVRVFSEGAALLQNKP